MSKKTLSSHALIGILVLMIMMVFPQSVSSDTGSTLVYVDPDSLTVTTCGTQTIAIRVENVQDLTGYHLEIAFDPEVIEVTNVVNGGFLAPPGEIAFYEPTNEIDNINGLVRFGMVQQGDGAGDPDPKSGDGTLIEMTLQAIAPNLTSPIEIDAVESILVSWPNAEEIEYTSMDGSVSTESCDPTGIALTNYQISENEPAGTEIGTFVMIDPEVPNDSFTYELVTGEGSDDNASFEVLGASLRSGQVFNYEEQHIFSIRVRSTDWGGKIIEKIFTIFVLDINEPPIAYDQDIYTEENRSVEFILTAFDVDGDDLTFEILSTPVKGILSGVAPDLTFTPDRNYLGLDSFTFRVYDGDLYSGVATVNIFIDEKKGVDMYCPIFMNGFNWY